MSWCGDRCIRKVRLSFRTRMKETEVGVARIVLAGLVGFGRELRRNVWGRRTVREATISLLHMCKGMQIMDQST